MSSKFYDQCLNNIFSEIAGLRKEDLEKLAEQVYSMLESDKPQDSSVHCLMSNTAAPKCKKCGSSVMTKYGRDAKGHQRYRCSICGAVVNNISSTVFCGTQKSAEQWKDFIKYTLEGHSLRYCAEHCHISLPTSFSWRHKIMNALTGKQFADQLSGLIEVDEMFVNVSYKGNHKNSRTFIMPRPAYRRGSDNRSRYARDKACVLCAAERNKGFSGVVTHRGTLNTTILSKVFDDHIAYDSIVITDESTALQKYFSDKPFDHQALASSVTGSSYKTVPEVKGTYHINNINAFHKRFRAFLSQFNGVATKHLNSYLSLFIWIENTVNKTTFSTTETLKHLCSEGRHITYKEITEMPLLGEC